MVHITWQQIRNDQACPSKKQKEACRWWRAQGGRQGWTGVLNKHRISIQWTAARVQWTTECTTSTSSPAAGTLEWHSTYSVVSTWGRVECLTTSQAVLDGATLRPTISIQIQKIRFRLRIVTVEPCWGPISPQRSSRRLVQHISSLQCFRQDLETKGTE